jgi:hypothetical protein
LEEVRKIVPRDADFAEVVKNVKVETGGRHARDQVADDGPTG